MMFIVLAAAASDAEEERQKRETIIIACSVIYVLVSLAVSVLLVARLSENDQKLQPGARILAWLSCFGCCHFFGCFGVAFFYLIATEEIKTRTMYQEVKPVEAAPHTI